jgi:hypothetical protein
MYRNLTLVAYSIFATGVYGHCFDRQETSCIENSSLAQRSLERANEMTSHHDYDAAIKELDSGIATLGSSYYSSSVIDDKSKLAPGDLRGAARAHSNSG